MFYEHKVISNIKLNSKFRWFCFKVKQKSFHHKTGQYVTIKITDRVFRCYSISSLPAKLPLWNMFVDISPGGPGTTYLKSLLKNDTIISSKPSGNFILNKGKTIYIFAAIGCGIAPFIPMIEKLTKYKNTNIYLYWGLRNEKDIALIKQLKLFSKANNNLKINIHISKPNRGYKGKKGHIISPLVKQIKQIPIKNSIVYLSGSGIFVNKTTEILINNNYPISQIRHEACY